jgi:hypothetical protein
VPRGCLPEGAAVPVERRYPTLAETGVVPIDEVPEWPGGEVLEQRQADRQAPRLDRDPPPSFMEGQPEERAVHRVKREADRPPPRTVCERLAEHCDVRLIGTEQTLVERLREAPDRRRDRAGRR